jgi:hypothetical protein
VLAAADGLGAARIGLAAALGFGAACALGAAAGAWVAVWVGAAAGADPDDGAQPESSAMTATSPRNRIRIMLLMYSPRLISSLVYELSFKDRRVLTDA